MSAAAKTASKLAVNLLTGAGHQEPRLLCSLAEVHQQVAGLLRRGTDKRPPGYSASPYGRLLELGGAGRGPDKEVAHAPVRPV